MLQTTPSARKMTFTRVPSSQRILIVEDHADTRASLYQLLTREGFSVLTADNGQQALDLLDGGIRPALILIDLMLPKVSGFDLITHLRTDPELRVIPTVVITAMPKDEVRVIADVVLHKPLDFEPLVATVRNLTRSH
jgi:DNA-binding response OmpR family regulator